MKYIRYLCLLLLFPMLVWAYSNEVYLGGDTLGILVNSKGVMVVGYYLVEGENINTNIEVGDRIIKVSSEEVTDTSSLALLIKKYMNGEKVNLTILRNEIEREEEIELKYINGSYRTGLYVKGNLLGIGTLTYIDPSTGVYGVLGHSLNYSQINQRVEIDSGSAFKTIVSGFTRSKDGNPGSKNADILKDSLVGTIEHNSSYGIFGFYKEDYDKQLYEVASLDYVKLGEAYMYTTNENNEIKAYQIKILDINKNTKEKNIYFEIVDDELINMSGGVVQGMSGSPIVQNGKLIGAVTRVLVEDVTKGYGISIITMLEEGDKISS